MARRILREVPVLLAVFLFGSITLSAETEFVVIVHPSHSSDVIDRGTLERVYRRHIRFWPDRTPVLPVNLPPDSPVRRRFSTEVLRTEATSLAMFWNRRYFHGVLPPPVLRSPQAVRGYVANTPGAIGYVPREFVDATVKVLEVEYDD